MPSEEATATACASRNALRRSFKSAKDVVMGTERDAIIAKSEIYRLLGDFWDVSAKSPLGDAFFGWNAYFDENFAAKESSMNTVIVRYNQVGKAVGILFTSMVLVTLGFLFSMVCVGGEINNNESIQGTWLPSAAELGGNIFPDEVRKTIKLVVKDDKYTVTVGQVVDQGDVKLNPAAAPKELDITGTNGPNKGKTFHAIYERNGDILRICYDLSGTGRPTEFATKNGTQLFLVTYRLEKN